MPFILGRGEFSKKTAQQCLHLTTESHSRWGPSLVAVLMSHCTLFCRHQLLRKQTTSPVACSALPVMETGGRRGSRGQGAQEGRRPFKDICIAGL